MLNDKQKESLKMDLRLAITNSRIATKTYEDFCNYLERNYKVKALEIANVLFFLHSEAGNELISASSLGENYSKEAIIQSLGKKYDGKLDTEEERLKYYKWLYKETFNK